ncbi:MAG: hypothetical protein ACTTKW_04865 [Schwartzia sp. (in: firmicutes)]
MRYLSTSHHRRRLTALVLGGLLFTSTASAANLLTGIVSGNDSGRMGVVTGSRVTTKIEGVRKDQVVTGLNTDSALLNFLMNGTSYNYVRQYKDQSTDPLDGYLYNDKIEKIATTDQAEMQNTHAVAADDRGHIFTTDYDQGKIAVSKIVGDRLNATPSLTRDILEDIIEKADAIATAEGYIPGTTKVHGEGLTVIDGKLYALASVNLGGGFENYGNAWLIRYDIDETTGTLTWKDYKRVGRNTDRSKLNRYNNKIAVASMHDKQVAGGSGHPGDIYVADFSSPGTASDHVQRPANVQCEIRDLKVLPNGTAYVLTYDQTSDYAKITPHIYQTTISNLLSDHPEDWTELMTLPHKDGSMGQIDAEYYTKRFWTNLGNEVEVYTDGGVTRGAWRLNHFSGDQHAMFFNSVGFLRPDAVRGTLAAVQTVGADGSLTLAAATVNPDAAWDPVGSDTGTITASAALGGDTTVTAAATGNLRTNVTAGIYADAANIDVDVSGHILKLRAENGVATPEGIYAGNGKNVTVKASAINILTKGVEGGNSLTNAIQLDPTKDGGSSITLGTADAPTRVNIAMTGGYGGNGVAIQKTDVGRFKEKSYEAANASSITLHGDLKIAGNTGDRWGIPLNRENVFSRFNNAGILTQVEKSRVDVTGSVDMTVYGNGVTVNAADSLVRLGGGSIQVPSGKNYGYYALAAYQGTINMNSGTGSTPGAKDVKLAGDLFALSSGRLNVALTTEDSYLRGIVDAASGTANLWLQNGAKWYNTANNTRYEKDDEDVGAGQKSHINRFVGGEDNDHRGIIYQRHDKGLTLDNYSGHAVAIYRSAANTVTGGDLIVGRAAEGSVLTLRTQSTPGAVQATLLEALANKLTYKTFTENKLTGKLEIGEGLTTPSVTGNILFQAGGRGSYDTTPPPPMQPLTTAEATGGVYTLAHNETRQLTQVNITQGFNEKDAALASFSADSASGAPADLTVDLNGYKLTLDMTSNRSNTAAIYGGVGKMLIVRDTPGNGALVLRAKQTKTKSADAIQADKNAVIRIEAPVEVTSVIAANRSARGIYANENARVTLKKLTLRNISAAKDPGTYFNVYGIGAGKSAEVTIDEADIAGVKGMAVYGMNIGNANTKIKIGGGKIIAEEAAADDKQYWAVYAPAGNVILNENKNRDLNVVGNMQAGDNAHTGTIDASFTTAESSWKGAAHVAKAGSEVKLTLANGAKWTHEVLLGGKLSAIQGSHLTKFTGGDTAEKAGIVEQGNKAITIDEYSGHTRFLFGHDAAAPTTIHGGNVTITKATDGSKVVLSTTPNGVTEGNVKDVLNALANKLYYTNYKNNERKLTGSVEINEGLISSAARWAGAITFRNADGRGSYDTNATPSQPSEEQKKTEFTSQITSGNVAEYVNDKVEKTTGVYTFTKDTKIKLATYNGAIKGDDSPVTVNAAGKVLTIDARKSGSGFVVGIAHSGSAGTGAMDITAQTLNLKVEGQGKVYGFWNMGNNTLRIKGDTNLTVKGGASEMVNGIYATGSGGTIHLDGLTLQQEKVGSSEHRSIHNSGRNTKVYINVDGDGHTGASKVDVQGDVLTKSESDETVTNIALTTADSKLIGLVEAQDQGKVNLWLQNGASWTNEHYGRTTTIQGSHVTKLIGGASESAAQAGNVYMNSSRDLTIDRYAGHTNFFYDHSVGHPDQLNGGDVKIKSAEAGSSATMITDNRGVTAANLNDVLQALAQKLWYMESDASHNLKGRVKVAEGLTSSSAAISGGTGFIDFDETTHQGKYSPTEPIYQDQSKENFTTPITNTVADTEYTDDGVRKSDGRYVFTKDKTTITTSGTSIPGGANLAANLNAGISNVDTTKRLPIDLKGHDLTVSVNAVSHTTGISAIGDGSEVVINNAGNLDIKSVGTGMDAALFVNGGGKITINARDGKVIKLRTEAALPTNGAVVKSMNGTSGVRSSITLNGQVDIEADGAKSNEAVSAVASDIRIAGGAIKAVNGAQWAVRAYKEMISTNEGRVYINVAEDAAGAATGAKDNQTVIEGNFSTSGSMGAKGVINVGLNTADSSWTGDYTENNDGSVNLWMGRNATWTGKTGTNSNLNLNLYGSGSLWKMTGSSHIRDMKASNQTGRNLIDLTATQDTDRLDIENFSGKAWFYYKNTVTTTHDDDTDTDTKTVAINGADIHVKKAAAGSEITLHTATNAKWDWTLSASPTEQNLTSEVFKSLARKFWYEDAAANGGNLKLTVRVSEGLTTSEASRSVTMSSGVRFDTANNGRGDYTYTPLPVPPPSTAIRKTKALTKNFVASATEPNASGEKYVSALYPSLTEYTKAHPMIVNLNNFDLTVKAESNDKAARAIFLGANAAVDIQNATGKTLTIKATNSSTRGASGIYLDGNSALTVAGPVVIDEVTSQGYSTSGIVTGGGIENSSSVTINGSLTIRKIQGNETGEAGDGRNLSALNTLSGESSITVTGDADIQDIKGSVIKVNGTTGYKQGGTIRVGGGILSAAADPGKEKPYRLVNQQTGNVHINMAGTAPGARKTVLKGDMYVVSESGQRAQEYGGGTLTPYAHDGTLNVALTTNDSTWHGAALYEEKTTSLGTGGSSTLKAGNFNLWLQNGALWTNEQLSAAPTTWHGSHVTKLTGGAVGSEGAIFQKDDKPLTIDHYDGQLKVFYQHTISGQTPTITGGDTIIGSAASGSVITLVTDKTDLDPAAPGRKKKNLVSATLNALANKLWYTARKSGETHLTGKVMIADGLTTSSSSLRLEDVTFDGTTGQGRYDYTPLTFNQTVTAFTAPVTGDEATDTDYVTGGVLEDASYTFSKDTTITAANGIKGSAAHKIDASILDGKTLTITATGAAIEAGAGSDIHLGGGKTVMTTSGTHVVTTAAGSTTSLKGGFDITGAIENAGTLTLADQGAVSSLIGNIDNTGILTLSLTGAGSVYRGAVAGSGDADLTLGASALWENKGASKLKKFTGALGSVVDMTPSGDTTIAEYSGNSTLYFPHAAGTPKTMQGGDLTITKAAAGSHITLRTNQAGLNVDPNATTAEKNLVSQTLDALANKLYYMEKNGTEVSDHLTGTVEIAEGITSSSVARSGSITFDAATGKGSYEYIDFGALKKNVTLRQDEMLSGESPLIAAANTAPAGPITVDLSGHTLTVNGTASKSVDTKNRPLTIKDTAGRGKFAVHATASGALFGLDASKNGLVVDAATEITAHNDSGALTAVNAASTNAASYEVKFTKFLTLHDIYTGNKGENNGNNTVAIRQAGRGEFIASGGVRATEIYGTILHNRGTKDLVVNGGDITLEAAANATDTTTYLVAHAQTPGKICINTAADGTAGTGTTKVKGDVLLGAGHAYLSLTNGDSAWTGTMDKSSATAAGTMTLNLANGAKWTNQRLYLGDPVKAAPVVEHFTGGNSLVNAGVIDQTHGDDLTLKNYSGNTIVWYGHTIAAGVDRDGQPAKVPTIQGGKITIASASAGSEIHLRTDSAGFDFTSTAVAERNLISATLNALANKLYYEDHAAHPGNLKAYVEIGEGLIGSSARISKEITTFTQTNPADGTDFQGHPFNTEDKQGAYVYTPDWVVPDTQQKADFTTPITGDWDEAEKTGADLEYAKGGVIHSGKYGFTQDTVIHPAAGSAITNAASHQDITVKAQNANLTVNGADWAIEAAAGHKIDITGDKAITLQGAMGSLTARSGAAVNLMATGGLTLMGNIQNSDGKVSLDGGSTAKSTFTGQLVQNGGDLTLRMVGAESSFLGDVDNQKGHVLIDLSGERTVFRGAVRGSDAPEAITEIRLGKAAGARFTEDSKVTTLNAGESADVKVDAGKNLTIKALNVGHDTAVTAETGGRVTAATVTATGSVKLAADGAITVDTMLMTGGGTLEKTGIGVAALKNMSVSKETTLNAATSGLTIENMNLGNTLLRNSGTADVAVKNLISQTGGRLFLGSNATVQTDKFSGDLNVLKNATMNADGTVTANHGKFRFRAVDAGKENRLTLSAVGMTLEDSRTGTAEEQQAKKKRNENALLSLYRQSIQADVAPGAITQGNTYKDADGNQKQGYRINHLAVNLATMESLTGSSATAFGNVLFDSAGNAAALAEQQIGYGDYETMVMQSTKGAMTSSAMVWRNEMNDVMKRMGDLRLSPGDLGGWVRFYKGRTSSDKDKASFRMNYTTIQAGYDWKVGKDWRVGIAGSYMKGSSSYATGSGDNKSGNFAVYGTWTGERGQYVDLIAKVGRVANEFNAANAWGNVRATGEYSTWGESISAEYGRRFKTDGSFYFEPQVELTFGRLNGADYDMASNGYGTLHVRQSGLSSAIGRLGIALGQETEKATWFVKASLYHEFAGNMDTAWEVAGNPTKYTRQEGKDTWLALQLGGTVKLNEGLSLYGDFEKTFSGDIKTDWRVDAGLRWSF